MSMSQLEFFCDRTQERPSDWREHYRHKIFIFERHRVFEPSRDLGFLIARWLEKRQHVPKAGYVHQVQFPEQPAMEMLAWTAYRAFQLDTPMDHAHAPQQLVFFTTPGALLRWKQNYWQRTVLPYNHGFMVHNCYDPSGERMKTSRLLTFDG